MSWGRAILWCATIGALAVALRSALGEPPPLGYAVGAFVGYLAILTVLALVPRLEAFGDYLCRVPEAEGVLALTFDDGPDPRTTPEVLKVLSRRGQKATFFVIGWKAEAHPELVRQIHEQGHQLALHGYHHDRLYSFKTPAAVKLDIELCQQAVERAVGLRPALFRPPIGQASPRTFAGAKRAGVELVGWSVRPADGMRWSSADGVAARVVGKLAAGVIVLLHDATEKGSELDPRVPPSLGALPRICDELDARRLRSVTLEELIAAAEPQGRPPEQPQQADG